MKASLIYDGEIINLEIPLTKTELELLNDKTPIGERAEAYARELVVAPQISGEAMSLPDDLVARIKRDIVLAYIEHTPVNEAEVIIKEVSKLVTYCLNK